MLGHVVDSDRMGMMQPRGDAPLPQRLALGLLGLGLARAGVQQLLDRHDAVQELVARLPDHPHCAVAYSRDQPVASGKHFARVDHNAPSWGSG
jgi:hypothetical protein